MREKIPECTQVNLYLMLVELSGKFYYIYHFPIDFGNKSENGMHNLTTVNSTTIKNMLNRVICAQKTGRGGRKECIPIKLYMRGNVPCIP